MPWLLTELYSGSLSKRQKYRPHFDNKNRQNYFQWSHSKNCSGYWFQFHNLLKKVVQGNSRPTVFSWVKIGPRLSTESSCRHAEK